MTVAAALGADTGFNRWVRRSPITAFFLLAYGGTWLALAPAVLSRNGLGWVPATVPAPLFLALFLLSSFGGPTLAGYLVTRALGGKPAVRRWLRRYLRWRVGIRWYALAVLGYPLLYLITATFWSGAAPWRALSTGWPAFFTSYLPALLVFPAIITWGEEPGWRGVALPMLQQKLGPLGGSIVLGLLHGAWHLPVFLIPAFFGRPFTFSAFGFNTLLAVVVTLSWTWLYNRTRGSILLAVLVHASSNATDGFIGQLVPVFPLGGHAKTIALVAATVLIVLATRGTLGYDERANAELLPSAAPRT